MKPVFLALDDVLALHARAIAEFGGTLGIRDVGLLESTLATPMAAFEGEWLHSTLFDMAAAYLFHIGKNHPFLDGNKRAALAAALLFLGFNGLQLSAPDHALTDLVLAIAEGRMGKSESAVFFKKHSVARRRWE
jgi:death-on-curing protein